MIRQRGPPVRLFAGMSLQKETDRAKGGQQYRPLRPPLCPYECSEAAVGSCILPLLHFFVN